MSLLIDVTKKVQGKSIKKASPLLIAQRLQQCNNCEHRVDGMVRSCGKFLKGGAVKHNGEDAELCGCNIDDKVKYREDGCPLGKW